jgi:hypothetical protein
VAARPLPEYPAVPVPAKVEIVPENQYFEEATLLVDISGFTAIALTFVSDLVDPPIAIGELYTVEDVVGVEPSVV